MNTSSLSSNNHARQNNALQCRDFSFRWKTISPRLRRAQSCFKARPPFLNVETRLHLLATCLRVNANLRLEQDLIDPQLRHGSRVRVGDLRQLYRDALREFRELLFRSLPFLQLCLIGLVQVATRTTVVLQRAVVRLQSFQARARRLLGVLAERGVQRASPRPVRFLVAVYEGYALGIDVANYVLLLQLGRHLFDFLRREEYISVYLWLCRFGAVYRRVYTCVHMLRTVFTLRAKPSCIQHPRDICIGFI